MEIRVLYDGDGKCSGIICEESNKIYKRIPIAPVAILSKLMDVGEVDILTLADPNLCLDGEGFVYWEDLKMLANKTRDSGVNVDSLHSLIDGWEASVLSVMDRLM